MPDGWCPFAERIVGVRSFTPGGSPRVGFCDHTAGGFYSTLRNAGFWNTAGVSVHFSISRAGEICQTVSIFDTAFAQGRLGPRVSWPPYAAMGFANPNTYLISTEHEDAYKDGGITHYSSVWTPAMYAADIRLKRWCVEEVLRVQGVNLLRFGIDSLAGHHMFDAVDRANCPGAPWRNEYRDLLYRDLTTGDDMSQDEINELADRRAYDILCLSAMNWRGVGDLGSGMYRTVAVAEENGMLIIELQKPDRTPYDNPIRIPVPKPD